MRIALATLIALALTASPAMAEYRGVADVTIIYAPCPDYPQALGCVTGDQVYVAHRGDHDTRFHELGHVWERRILTDIDRAWFARLVGLPGRPWSSPIPGTVSPEERFADAFALCARGVRVQHGEGGDTGYGYVPTVKRHRRICNAIAVLDLLRHP